MSTIFARRLAQAMEMQQLNQMDLERISGVTQTHISMMLSGRRAPGLEVAAKLAQALSVSLDWLAGIPSIRSDEFHGDVAVLVREFRSMNSGALRLAAIQAVRAVAQAEKEL